MGVFPGIKVFLEYRLNGLTVDWVFTFGGEVQSSPVNPVTCLLKVLFGQAQAFVPNLSRRAVTGEETVDVVFGCVELGFQYPNDTQHLLSSFLTLFYHTKEREGTSVREILWGRRFISPPVEVGVFSPYGDKSYEGNSIKEKSQIRRIWKQLLRQSS